MTNEVLLEILKLALNKPETITDSTSARPTGQHLCVLDRGFVYVGNVRWEGKWMVIDQARNVRVWGATEGLGQLRNGPLKETKLDECGRVLVLERAVIHLIPCTGF